MRCASLPPPSSERWYWGFPRRGRLSRWRARSALLARSRRPLLQPLLRGRGDLLRSLDIHGVLTLVDGRPELIEEIDSASPALCTYIKDELAELRAEPYF
jgi:hypothetical protein